MFFRGHQGSTRKFWNLQYRHHILIFVFLWSMHFPSHFRMHWIFNNPITWCGCIHFFPLRHFNTIITIRENGQRWNCCSDIVNFAFIGFVFLSADFTRPLVRWKMVGIVCGRSEWEDWSGRTEQNESFLEWPSTLIHHRSLSPRCKKASDLTQDRPLLLVRPRWTRLKMTSLPMQLKRASLRIRVTTAEGSGLTFSRWKILTGRPVGDKHVTLYGPLASLGSINSPDTFVANIFSSPWSKTEKNKVSSLQTG